MLGGLVLIEDGAVQIAHVVDEDGVNVGFDVTFGDTVTGKRETRRATGVEVGAILALAFG